jgi:GLTT repeat (6 copies)
MIRMRMGGIAAAQRTVELTHVRRLQAGSFGAGRLATGGFGGTGLGPRGLSGSGLVAPGVIAAGLVAAGLVSVGLVSAGLVAPGLVAAGLVAPGLVAPGLVAPGLVAPGLVAPGMPSAWGVHRLGTRLIRVHRLWARDLRIEGVRSVGHRAIELAHVGRLESWTGGGARPTGGAAEGRGADLRSIAGRAGIAEVAGLNGTGLVRGGRGAEAETARLFQAVALTEGRRTGPARVGF